MKRMIGLVVGILLPVFCLANDEANLDEAGVIGFYGDEDFISIAIGEVQPIAKAPAVATVITAAEINQTLIIRPLALIMRYKRRLLLRIFRT